jgi:chemotaxis signal transduction protein
MSGHFPWKEARERVAKGFQEPARTREEVLRERAEHLARPLEPLVAPSEDRICLAVGDAWASVPSWAVRSIGRLGALTPIPGAPPELLGLARVRGALTPIFDLGPVLTGGATERSERSRVLILRAGGADLAVVAGALADDTPNDGAEVLVLDVEKLLGDARLTVDQRDEL